MATPVKLCAAKHVDSQPDLARKMKNRLRSLRHGRLESSSLEYNSLTIHSLSASLSVLTASYATYPPNTSYPTCESYMEDVEEPDSIIPNLSTHYIGSRVVSVLDSGAEGPGFKSQSRRCRVTVLGKLFTHPLWCLCSPSSKISSSPLKGCGDNCRLGGKLWQPIPPGL